MDEKVILLDLDALFDTRLGIIEEMDAEAAKYIETRDAYWIREYNDWSTLTNGKIDSETFENRWLERSNEDLHRSKVTGIFAVLNQIITAYRSHVKEGLQHQDVVVELNLGQYTLTDVEEREMTYLLRRVLGEVEEYRYTSLPYEVLTPEVIDERYAAIVHYDFHRWIKYHAEALGEHPIPSVNLIAPRLFEKDPTELSKEDKQVDLALLKSYLLHYIDLEFIDAKWFSAFRPPAKAS